MNLEFANPRLHLLRSAAMTIPQNNEIIGLKIKKIRADRAARNTTFPCRELLSAKQKCEVISTEVLTST